MGDACTPDFVSISENGTHFEVNGAPFFFFAGCNTYYMMARAPLHIAILSVNKMSLTWSEGCPTRASAVAVPICSLQANSARQFTRSTADALQTRAADPGLRHEVTEVLDAAQKAKLSVVRTWAFCKSLS